MIALDKIRIHGFRSISRLEMSFSRTSVLIGPNNCGKSTVLKALQLALTDEREAVECDLHRTDDDRVSNEIMIDVRFVPIDTGGQRMMQFEPEWRKVLEPGIRTERRRDYFSFRTRFVLKPDTGKLIKERRILTDWNSGTAGQMLVGTLPALQMCLLEADDDLQSVMARPNAFIDRTFEALRGEILAHPQYADVTFDKLRAHLNRLSETLEGPGSKLPDGLVLSPITLERFFNWAKRDAASDKLRGQLGLGSRKTLLILSAVTLIEGLVRRARAHGWPLFILIAAEEPEGHLHPNAQRTLMTQLTHLSHQLLVSTHSPYVAASVDPEALRSMTRESGRICVRRLPKKTDSCDVRALKRLILRLRGEVLFAKGLMLVEGVTEEQLIRGMFHAYFGDDPSTFGISIIGVDGKSYAPFFLLAMSFRKPFCVVSDNDGDTAHVVLKQLADMEQKAQFDHKANMSDVFFLSPGLAMEGELVHKLRMRDELIDSLMACSPLTNPSEKSLQRQRERFHQLTNRDLKRRLEKEEIRILGLPWRHHSAKSLQASGRSPDAERRPLGICADEALD